MIPELVHPLQVTLLLSDAMTTFAHWSALFLLERSFLCQADEKQITLRENYRMELFTYTPLGNDL